MPEENQFQSLVRRVRGGDADAATQLVREYESHIRRAARFGLRDSRLRRTVDSMDISQSVLASFFTRAALGQFELDRPEQLVNLLAAMARNKLASRARQSHVTRRDRRDIETVVAEVESGRTHEPGMLESLAHLDLVSTIRARLTEEERWISDQRLAGREWAEIAAITECKADALRMKLTRALDRVSRQLGLDADDGSCT